MISAAAKPESRRHALLGLAAALLLAACTATLLLRFPPEQYHFYPQCPIHLWLHLECPGCGATRALAALLHGRLRDALRLNALFVAGILPTATLYAAITLTRAHPRAAPRSLPLAIAPRPPSHVDLHRPCPRAGILPPPQPARLRAGRPALPRKRDKAPA